MKERWMRKQGQVAAVNLDGEISKRLDLVLEDHPETHKNPTALSVVKNAKPLTGHATFPNPLRSQRRMPEVDMLPHRFPVVTANYKDPLLLSNMYFWWKDTVSLFKIPRLVGDDRVLGNYSAPQHATYRYFNQIASSVASSTHIYLYIIANSCTKPVSDDFCFERLNSTHMSWYPALVREVKPA
ncbi:hypothetical protein SODALDRAFT_362481 [Sodiomyces alkalinus F11]|uniref:Uncharacterized protein n=1 Tax=Sodiomyces alkalinus (strain CBS 110278 / VKM F-3762 / F11) TaxID=1314773 RepID=A0A3N2PQ70_SODAK|nr:hypothetical protein SODALDRAFT_362481 [Sodiomyces alkalinus F11]ROT36657.1 hypothetical protein SODALDRAFT_362481 [Sodiomyces alkalinus F11]